MLIFSVGAASDGASVDADAVRRYLQTHPEFLLEHEELAAAALAQGRTAGLREGMERRRQAMADLARPGGKSAGPLKFRGRLQLVYFGFTQCPDVCPVTLANIAKAMRLLADKADLVQPLFISIDPERDRPGILAQYVHYFDSAMIGLTGTPEQIARVQAAFGVTNEKIPAQNGTGSHAFQHSAWIYLMGDNGQMLERFPGHIAPDALAAAMAPFLTTGTP